VSVSTFTQAIADEICERLADGASLRRICEADDMPNVRTVRRWLAASSAFAAQYALAREEQAEFHHAEMDDIEDKVLTGKLKADAANAVLSNKRWRMEKLKPRVYGVRMTVAGDAENPLTLLTNEHVDKRIEDLLKKANGDDDAS
jgi:hypothetical protein